MRTQASNYVGSSFMGVFIGIIFSIIYVQLSWGQVLPEGQKRWSSDSKLTVDDFKIKISDINNEIAYSQFMITHAIGGLDFMKKNMNQKVENLFLGNASYIDTTKTEDLQKQIDFQQMQFDLSEIQARSFRKRALKDKGQLTKGFDIINKINNEIMAELTEMRMTLMRETDSGRNEEKLEEWKELIATKLKELDEFRFENKEKIKLQK